MNMHVIINQTLHVAFVCALKIIVAQMHRQVALMVVLYNLCFNCDVGAAAR